MLCEGAHFPAWLQSEGPTWFEHEVDNLGCSAELLRLSARTLRVTRSAEIAESYFCHILYSEGHLACKTIPPRYLNP